MPIGGFLMAGCGGDYCGASRIFKPLSWTGCQPERRKHHLDVHAEFKVSAHTHIRTLTSGGFEAGVRLVRLRPPEFPLLPRQKESKDWLTLKVWALLGLWLWGSAFQKRCKDGTQSPGSRTTLFHWAWDSDCPEFPPVFPGHSSFPLRVPHLGYWSPFFTAVDMFSVLAIILGGFIKQANVPSNIFTSYPTDFDSSFICYPAPLPHPGQCTAKGYNLSRISMSYFCFPPIPPFTIPIICCCCNPWILLSSSVPKGLLILLLWELHFTGGLGQHTQTIEIFKFNLVSQALFYLADITILVPLVFKKLKVYQ